MAVMAKQAKYHRFGRAVRRVMNSENVQMDSQEEAARKLSEDGGFPCDQRLVSNYMRFLTSKNKDTGEEIEKPRTIAPIEFVFAWGRAFDLTQEQQMDLLDSWLEIQPEDRRDALLAMCKALNEDNVPSEAVEDMLDFESQRPQRELNRGTGDRAARDRES